MSRRSRNSIALSRPSSRKGRRKAIAGNDQYGVGVYNHSTNNTVSHNCIGISSTGKSLPNTKNPISVWISTNNTITYNKIVLGGKWTPIQISSGLTTTLTANTTYGIISSGVQVM